MTTVASGRCTSAPAPPAFSHAALPWGPCRRCQRPSRSGPGRRARRAAADLSVGPRRPCAAPPLASSVAVAAQARVLRRRHRLRSLRRPHAPAGHRHRAGRHRRHCPRHAASLTCSAASSSRPARARLVCGPRRRRRARASAAPAPRPSGSPARATVSRKLSVVIARMGAPRWPALTRCRSRPPVRSRHHASVPPLRMS